MLNLTSINSLDFLHIQRIYSNHILSLFERNKMIEREHHQFQTFPECVNTEKETVNHFLQLFTQLLFQQFEFNTRSLKEHSFTCKLNRKRKWHSIIHQSSV